MQFLIEQEEGVRALQAIQIKGHGTLEILSQVLIEVKDAHVSFTTTNLDVRLTYRATQTVQIIEEGRYVVNFQQLLETMKSLPRRLITFQQGNQEVILTCAGRTFVEGKDATDFPEWKARTPGETYRRESGAKPLCTVLETAGTQQVSLSREVLLEALRQVVYAAADTDDPMFEAVFLAVEKDHVIVMASDNFRLAKAVVRLDEAVAPWRCPALIHAHTCVELVKRFPRASQMHITCSLTLDTLIKEGPPSSASERFLTMTQVRMAADAHLLLLRPHNGVALTYPRLSHQDRGTMVVAFPTAELLRAYTALLPMAKQADTRTRLNLVEGQQATITASQPGHDPAIQDVEILSSTDLAPTAIDLNVFYVLDVLKAAKRAKSAAIELALQGPEQPVHFRWAGRDGDMECLLMPLGPQKH